jgi:hypothetical protein
VAQWSFGVTVANTFGFKFNSSVGTINASAYCSTTACNGQCTQTLFPQFFEVKGGNGAFPVYYPVPNSARCGACPASQAGVQGQTSISAICGPAYAALKWTSIGGATGLQFPGPAMPGGAPVCYPASSSSQATGAHSVVKVTIAGQDYTILDVQIANTTGIAIPGNPTWASVTGRAVQCAVNTNGTPNFWDYQMSVYNASSGVNLSYNQNLGQPCAALNQAMGVPNPAAGATCGAALGL